MISEEILRDVIDNRYGTIRGTDIIPRDRHIITESDRIIVISGVRRCGKSTLLIQGLQEIEKKITINFEDTRLAGFELSDFNKIEKHARESQTLYFIFDEIQNLEGWEMPVRSLHDKGFRIYITGSNASLLSREPGTKLTGRYRQVELFPFGFNEYLLFTKSVASEFSLADYLQKGGFPEALRNDDPDYLRTLFRDIIVRDIAVRRNIRNDQLLLRLAMALVSNTGKEISYNNLTRILDIKSVRTTIDYCDYLKESYLFDFIPRFSFSVKQQINNPKKVYCIDTGMARANSLSLSKDEGRMLENAVWLKLRSLGMDIMYYADARSECDFLIRKNEEILYAVQVCRHLNEENLERELNGLTNAMKTSGAANGVIVTFDQEDFFNGIAAIPAWKWLTANTDENLFSASPLMYPPPPSHS